MFFLAIAATLALGYVSDPQAGRSGTKAGGATAMVAAEGLVCADALLPAGWARNVAIRFAADGTFAEIGPATAADRLPHAPGPVLPGLPNLHSHAFQRALAGLTERAGPQGDDFWSWRQAVYRFVSRLTPEDVEAIAAHLYMEMLLAGYTAVGEFHYLHHDPAGARYADPAEMAWRIASAAEQAGIGLTLLPVLYAQGGFGGIPTEDGQRRYVCDEATFAAIVESLASSLAGSDIRLGIAPHSLRAVEPERLKGALALIDGLDPDAPVHIHIAEQTREVDECLAWAHARPVEWLLANAPVDDRWCLVHATHMTPEETVGLARSGAVAGLCPTTEADLGDGLFPAVDYLAAGGRFGVGSDSHVVVDGAEELRLLEFGQRLVHRRRNLLRPAGETSTGGALYRQACAGGARALGRPVGRIAVGARADLVALNGGAPILLGKTADAILDSFVFAGGSALVRDVWVGGRRVVEARRHIGEDAIAAAHRAAMTRLLSDQDALRTSGT